MDYASFLRSKRFDAKPAGFEPTDPINDRLFPWQADIVRWALRRGRAALFEDCGLGKTAQQLEWSRHVALHTGGNVLILAPLAVAPQTRREGKKFGIDVTVCRSARDVKPGVNVANYEMLHHFDPSAFAGIVLDESSILKAFEGSTRKAITEFGRSIPYRLACTATPAPNDLIELTNHAEFLDVMTGKEIIALFFTQDGNTTQKWRLKGHAREPFWRWLASWSVALRSPSDLGYDDGPFVLPPLNVHQVTVPAKTRPGMLFPMEAVGLAEQRSARRASLDDRVAACAEIANATSEPFLVWCDLNAESEALKRAIPGAVEVRGSDSIDHKERSMLGFSDGSIRVLVSKPTICGFGMNWQHCSMMSFVGPSNSFELTYQAISRCLRFGQTRPVDVYQIVSEADAAIVENFDRKERQAAEMFASIVRHMAGLSLGRSSRDVMPYEPSVEMEIPPWMTMEALV